MTDLPTPSERSIRILPRVQRPYQIEADWTLMRTCNYRCVYCYWDAADLGRKIRPIAPVEQLASFFDQTGLTWLLHLTGGEPFVYPHFVDLCALLTRRHFISINTNADPDRVRTFSETIDPARVDFVHCSVHLQQREERRRVAQFVRNVLTLRAAGFAAFSSCVMYPDVFATFPAAWDWYAEQGIVLMPKAFKGRHGGRWYPAAYSAEERALFGDYARRAEAAYADEFARRREPPTINPLLDQRILLDEAADFRGQLCEAGRRFVRIWEDGAIYRCGPADRLGHIVEGRFERRARPSVCTETECPYFCEKYRVGTCVGDV